MTTFCSFSRQAFLPHFHKENVDKVIDKFKNREGGEISTFTDSETLEHNKSPLMINQRALFIGMGWRMTLRRRISITNYALFTDRGT